MPEAHTHAVYKQDCNRASCRKRSYKHTQAMICNSNSNPSERTCILTHGLVCFIAPCTAAETSSINTCIGLPDKMPNSQFGLYLPSVVLLKAGNLLYKAVGGENCMQGLHIHRIRLVLYLHPKHSSHNELFRNPASSAAITQEFGRSLQNA